MNDETTDPSEEGSEGSIVPVPTVALGDRAREDRAAVDGAAVDGATLDGANISPASPREHAAISERSKDKTQLGLGAADGASVASQASGTLLGIAAVARPDRVLSDALPQSLQAPPGSAEQLPRFDDNPLIAAFAPQPRRPLSAFDGFVPLDSPTRAFSETVPPLLAEPALDLSRANVEIESPARNWRAPSRIVGLAAGCFGLAASLAVASHALTSAPTLEARASALTPAPPAPPAPPAENALAASVAVVPAEPALPPLTPPEAHAVAPTDLPTTHEPLSGPADAVPPDAGTPDDAVAEPESSRPASAPESPVATAAASAEATAPAEIEASAQRLDSHQLDQLFALETRSEAYRCAPATGADAPTGDGTSSAAALWRDWRRAQQNGDLDGARQDLCELGRISPNDARVRAELAALALRWGDARGAQEAARAGLLLRPDDAALKQLLGDALALVGELAESQRLWLEPFGADVANQDEVIEYYDQRGKVALERAEFAKARTFFRRAVVISGGALRSSAGLAEALVNLGETRAAVAWAERAALAAPRDAKLQLAYGDALYRVGDMAAARRAWSTAAQLRPSSAIRRRLARGHL